MVFLVNFYLIFSFSNQYAVSFYPEIYQFYAPFFDDFPKGAINKSPTFRGLAKVVILKRTNAYLQEEGVSQSKCTNFGRIAKLKGKSSPP